MKYKNRRFLLLGLLCFLLVNIISFSYFHILNQKFEHKIYDYLKEATAKNAEVMRTAINDDEDSLKILAAYLSKDSFDHVDETLKQINLPKRKGNFRQLNIADKNGICYMPDHKTLDISDYGYFQQSMKGATTVSQAMNDQIDHTPIIIFSTPIYDAKKNICGVLFGLQDTAQVTKNAMSLHLYEDSFSLIMDKSGKIALSSKSSQVHAHIEGTDRTYLSIKENGGISTYYSKSRDMDFLVSYASIGINDWYMVSFVPSYHAAAQCREFNLMSTLAILTIAFVIIVLLLAVHRMNRKNREEKNRLLFEDPLTKGRNFNWFMVQANDFQQASNDSCIWLLTLHIRDFRLLNDIYGYPAGDQLLLALDAALKKNPNYHFCVRKENDIFLMLIKKDAITEALQQLSDIQLQLKTDAAKLQINDIHLLGGYTCWQRKDSILTAMDQAILAMRRSTLKHPVTRYEMSMDFANIAEKHLEERMEEALAAGEFKVYVQPKVDAKTGNIVAGEALVRWQDPQRGMISPGEFIPLFERNGFLEQVDLYVYERVCQYIKRWQSEDLENIRISFNVSPTYIFQKGYVEKLCKVKEKLAITGDQLEVEITEGAIAENTRLLIEILQALHSEGYRIAMDDFGSGYSSLNMLKELPVDTLKIDQSFFVQEERYKQKSESIVSLVMMMAQRMHMDIVVEGIETEEQLNFVRSCGCHIIQGYYFYRPMPIEEFDTLIRKEKQDDTNR